MRDTVYIVGSTSHWEQTPWGEDAEYWGMNTMWRTQSVSRFTAWFELHHLETMYQNYPGLEDTDHLDWLREDHGIDVFAWADQIMTDQQINIRRGLPFPRDAVLEFFHPWRYFTNSVTWLVGYAIQSGAKKIGVYGVDMATSKEHRRERPSVEWLLGWALGAGIEIDIPDTSDLLHVGYLYGSEQALDVTEKVRAYVAELEERAIDLMASEQRYRRRGDELRGAVEALEYINYSWLEKPDGTGS